MDNSVAYRPNQYIEAGLFSRGDIRRSLAKGGVEFVEVKSLTSSVFGVKVSPAHWNKIVRALMEAYQ